MFRVDKNHSIFITKGDTAELDIRLFNKDWHVRREFEYHRPLLMPLLPLWDSEGFVFDSEGYPIYPVDSEGRPYHPERVWPVPTNSEGKPLIDLDKLMPVKLPFRPRMRYPRWRQIEEPIRRYDLITLRVVDLQSRKAVIVKTNDELPNSIFLLKEDTELLEPKQYLYTLTYEPYYKDMEPEDDEKNTVITGLFEIVNKL